ncbi:MAG: alpha/beta fold hydrolase [Gammaproteobacteria bacterium]|nr:alpha/beta fold hydrolase [Gammaproteobacteria bacterium]
MEERTARDGTMIAIRRWAVPSPKAAMLIVHGLGEHSGRYDHVARFFNGRGIDVTAFDLRGHGLSGGRRGYVGRWSDYLDDLEDRLLETQSIGAPVVLYGHSLGGLIAASYVTSDRPQPDALIASAPGLEDNLKPILHVLPKILGPLLPTLAVATGITADQLSRDPAVGEAYFADPLVLTKATLRLAAEALQAQVATIGQLAKISLPTLTIHGSEDSLVPPSASALLEPHAKRILYEGLRHECHNEPEQAKVLNDIATWVEEQVQA